MKQVPEITAIIQDIQAAEGPGFVVQQEAILAAYHKAHSHKPGIAIKVLTILGGILATIAFIGFLLVAGLYNSSAGLFLTGVVLIAGAVLVSRFYDILIFDSMAVAAFITGLLLLSMGLDGWQVEENIICLILLITGIAVMAIHQNYMISFLAALTVHGAIIALIVLYRYYNLLHVYIAVAILLFTLFMLAEARLLRAGKKTARLYEPLRLALIVALLTTLVLVGKQGLLAKPSLHFNLVSAIAAIAAILYLAPRILTRLAVQGTTSRTGICIAILLVLAPTAYAPAIPGALLIALLCFWVNYKTGVVLGIVALVYFIAQYYYDLQFTLLVKSLLLLSSGILFILFYVFTHKTLNHEKI